MKNTFTIFLLFICYFASSQSLSGEINYKAYPRVKENIDTTGIDIPKNLYQDVIKALKYFENITFKLTFNANYSRFAVENVLQSDLNYKFFSLAKIITMTNNIYYQNLKTHQVIEEVDGVYLAIDKKVKWTLRNGKKVINGYTCYKAVYSDHRISAEGKNFTVEIVAWYCPEFPVSLSPDLYNGLPGIVLELNNGNVVFVAKEIKYYKEAVKINFYQKHHQEGTLLL